MTAPSRSRAPDARFRSVRAWVQAWVLALAACASAGSAAAAAAASRVPPYDDPEAHAWVAGIVRRIAPRAGIDPRALRLTLLDSGEVNAFAGPGGEVAATRGLLEIVDYDDELAGVIAHEIAHVSRRHISTATRQRVLTGLAVGILGAVTRDRRTADLASALGNLNLLKYSRQHETDADDHGMRYMVEAGYCPRGMVTVMRKLAARGGGSRLTAFLSTHPDPGSRVAHNTKRLTQFQPERVHQPMVLTFAGFRNVSVPYSEPGDGSRLRRASPPAASSSGGGRSAAPADASWRTVRLRSGEVIRVRGRGAAASGRRPEAASGPFGPASGERSDDGQAKPDRRWRKVRLRDGRAILVGPGTGGP
jgi:predicted Zn-dependent protease